MVCFCVQENSELFRADTTSQPWKDYVNYIDAMVLAEFDRFIRKSLNYLTDNMSMDVSYYVCVRECVRMCVNV